MHPEAFIIVFAGLYLSIEPYAAAIVAALFVVSVGSWLMLKHDGTGNIRSCVLVASAGVAALIGARLWNGFLNWDLYQVESWRFMTLSAVGFSLYGGIIGGVAAGYLLARVLRIDVWRAADLAAPFVGIGVAIIRFGCFLRGCCFGETTDVFWGVTFPLFSPAHLAQLSSGQAELLSSHAVHPTQLYELVGALAVGAIAWALVKKKIFPNGVAALIAAAVFTLVRLTVYFFRVMPEAYGTPAYFYPMLYITILVALVVLIIRICRKDGRCERVFSIPGVGRGLS